jgi:hypothetical protein
MARAVSEDGHHAPVLSIPIYRAEIAGFPVQPSATDAKATVPAEIFGEVPRKRHRPKDPGQCAVASSGPRRMGEHEAGAIWDAAIVNLLLGGASPRPRRHVQAHRPTRGPSKLQQHQRRRLPVLNHVDPKRRSWVLLPTRAIPQCRRSRRAPTFGTYLSTPGRRV